MGWETEESDTCSYPEPIPDFVSESFHLHSDPQSLMHNIPDTQF